MLVDVFTPYRTIFLQDQEKASWDHYNAIGYPNSKDEEWRFSNPNPWLLSNPIINDKKTILKLSPQSYIGLAPDLIKLI